MEFRASAEVAKPAHAALAHCERLFEAELNRALENSKLTRLKGKFRYVPIIMPPDWAVNYPPRSKLRKNEGDGVYDCAPQLDYEIFVKGTFGEQVAEYTRGILLEASEIAGLGASLDQVKEFEDLITTARLRIAGSDSEATLHDPEKTLMERFMDCSQRAFQDGKDALSSEELRSELSQMRALIIAARDGGEAKAPRQFIDHYIAMLGDAIVALDEKGDVNAALEIVGSVEIPGLEQA